MGREVPAGECLRDLLDTSAKLLRPGGRLVYFMPAAPEVYREEEIPQHPALRLVANSEQVLSTKFSRRLITMEKVRRATHDAGPRAAFLAATGTRRKHLRRVSTRNMHWQRYDGVNKRPQALVSRM